MQRFMIFHRWKHFLSCDFSQNLLFQFHERYKKSIETHPDFQELENNLALITATNFNDTADSYIFVIGNVQISFNMF